MVMMMNDICTGSVKALFVDGWFCPMVQHGWMYISPKARRMDAVWVPRCDLPS